MKIKTIELAFIKSFKTLKFDLDRTSVLVGQNDHGKSSILKVLDIVLNQLDEETIAQGALHPDLAERLLPVFPVDAKARRVTLSYDENGVEKQLHVTVRADLTFTVLEHIARNAKTDNASLTVLKKLREKNRFVLIPALRDATSPQFQELFSRTLRKHGLTKMIPQKAGGTPKEYRTLKAMRDDISKKISPYVSGALLPQIEKQFGFQTEHKLALKFDVDVQQLGEWILSNLRLGFRLTEDSDATLALSEAGSGVQSGVLLALHRLEQQAAQSPGVQFILAVEEPEAYLHPQRQKELYESIKAARSSNLRVIITTHSPYIVSETPFTRLGLVKKQGKHSTLHVPEVKDANEQEVFDAYSDDVNDQLFFADKVILVEGESDRRVLKSLLARKLGSAAHRISVLSAAGNQNFSPFLRMIRAWSTAKIPHLVVTDFDSLTKGTSRAVIIGAKDAGYSLASESVFHQKVDGALDKGEKEFSEVAVEGTTFFKSAGLNVFVFTSDLEYALIGDGNKAAATKVMSQCSPTNNDYSQGYDLNALRRQIGSKGVPLNPMQDPPLKKPYIHRKLAETIDFGKAHPDITRLLAAIESLGS